MSAVCEKIVEEMGELYACAPVKDYVRIRTPYLYPDGDVIDLFLREDAEGRTTLTDLGETLRWLRMHAIADLT